MRNSLRRPETGPPPSATPGGRRPRAGSRWRGRALALTALGAAIIAFLIIVFGGGGGSGHTATQASTSAAKTSHQKKTAKHRRHRVTPTSTFRVGLTKFKLTEPAGSATPNAHTSTGASARVIPVGVRYPAQGQPNGHSNPRAAPDTAHGPYPLIVFSQGYDTAASAYAALINAWTTAGYIVAAPTYPFTDPSTPGGPNESDIVNHPTDLRFVLTSLLRGSGPAAPLKRLIDPSKTAVIGQSGVNWGRPLA